MPTPASLIYGANGYTGELIAREATRLVNKILSPIAGFGKLIYTFAQPGQGRG